MILVTFVLFISSTSIITVAAAIDILQIVPGFTNSHLLFNYRLATTLSQLGHHVKFWTQMEMNMVSSGVQKPNKDIPELQISIHFSDKMKTEGLKVDFSNSVYLSNFRFINYWHSCKF